VKGRGGEGDYFLCFGALAPYKRIDLAIAAFERLGWPLWIGGAGQETKWVSRVPKNVRVLGQVPDAALPELYRNARALVFPGIEDFGLTPLEAQASGRPVIAFRGGGALETVTEQTGLFFREQTVDALVAVLRSFDEFENRFDPDAARAHAMRFSKERFQRRFMEHVRTLVSHA
jgi:glycosyltransferase involved in cell wall biosynthesis